MKKAQRRVRETDPRKATIIKDIEGDECWIYEVGNAVGFGCMPKAEAAAGYACILDESRLDALIDALQAKREAMYGRRGAR
jgi:hypothetical protein